MLQRLCFLSQQFYSDYPSAKYPEIEHKVNRPYIQVCVEIGGIKYAIPLRSNINHPNVFWTDKAKHCGLDFSKAVVILKDEYIDTERRPKLRQNEFNALKGKEYRIKQLMADYVSKYKEARKAPQDAINRLIISYSTLQYFENEI